MLALDAVVRQYALLLHRYNVHHLTSVSHIRVHALGSPGKVRAPFATAWHFFFAIDIRHEASLLVQKVEERARGRRVSHGGKVLEWRYLQLGSREEQRRVPSKFCLLLEETHREASCLGTFIFVQRDAQGEIRRPKTHTDVIVHLSSKVHRRVGRRSYRVLSCVFSANAFPNSLGGKAWLNDHAIRANHVREKTRANIR